MKREKTDIVSVGTGVAGLFAALHLPRERQVLMLTKDDLENSDSFWLREASVCCGMKRIMMHSWRTP